MSSSSFLILLCDPGDASRAGPSHPRIIYDFCDISAPAAPLSGENGYNRRRGRRAAPHTCARARKEFYDMILSGREIVREMGRGIVIEPFDERRVNPNSYNLSLHGELLVYRDEVLDMKTSNETETLAIPEDGLLLEPGRLYLGRTVEYTRTDAYVPMLEGRSSTGRLGLCIHVTAGFATSASRATGRSRSSASSRCASTRGSRSARSTTTPSRGNTTSTKAESTRTTGGSSPA